MCPQRPETQTATEKYCAAQQQHDPLRDNSDREGEQRENHERDARLREYCGEIGDRQRLPEQNAAIATFAVQRVETVEHRDDKIGRHQQKRREVVRLLDELLLM